VIPAERAHLHLAASTHPGRSGKNNEDRYGISAFYADGAQKIPAALAIIADGIGGHKAGEIAAELAVETISQVVASGDASQPVELLNQAIIQAGQAIIDQAELDLAQKGMGSTVACALVIGSRLFIASVGDSRVYLIRGGKIRQLTTDHTWIQEAIEHGALQPGQARDHPNAHIIRRYLGSKQDVVPDIRLRLNPVESDRQAVSNQGVYLQPGDLIFLCSDGLTDLVSDAEILAAFKGRSDQAVVGSLVELANLRGGHDNITVLSLRVPPRERQARRVSLPAWLQPRRRVAVTCGIIAALLLASAGITGGFYWLARRSAGGAAPTPIFSIRQPTRAPAIGATALPDLGPGAPLPTDSPPASGEGPAARTSTPLPFGAVTPLYATLTPWPTNTLAP